MANHGWVDTYKEMTAESVTKTLEEINNRVFKGLLKVEYHNCVGKKDYGPHVWSVSYNYDEDPEKRDIKSFKRFCWISETGKHFEIRHGRGEFSWWWDCVTLNEVSVEYSGMIGDDGVDEIWAGEPCKFDTLWQFLRVKVEHVKPRTLLLRMLRRILNEDKILYPKEFHEDIKPPKNESRRKEKI